MKKEKHTLLTLFAIGLSALLILRDVAGVGISKYIYLAYVVAFMAIASYETQVHMLCFVLPLVCGLPGTYIMPCALVLMVVKSKNINVWQLLLVCFITIMELIASFWYPQADLVTILQYVSFAGVMFFLIHDKTEMDYALGVKMYLFGVCLLCGTIVAAALITAPANWLALFAKGHFRFGATQTEEITGMSLHLNANSMAYYSVTGLTCSIFLAEGKKGSRLGSVLIAIFMVASGFLTLSRSWLLVVAICLLLYIFSKLRTPKQFLWVTVVVAILIASATVYLTKNPELLQGFLARFTDDSVGSGGGRVELFYNYMKLYFSDLRYMFFGAGVTQYQAVFEVSASMHNGTQQILVCCGIVGFIVYMVALIKPVVHAGKEKKIHLVYWLPLISIVVFVQTIQFLSPMMLMLPYVIGIYALKAGGRSDEKVYHNGGYRGGQPLGMEGRSANYH